MSKNATQDKNAPDATTEGTCCCATAAPEAGEGCCGGSNKFACPCNCELTLAFWVLRLWLGFRAFFTGLSKFSSGTEGGATASSSGVPVEVTNIFRDNYGTAVADNAAQLANVADIAKQAAAKAAEAAAAGVTDPVVQQKIYNNAYNAAAAKVQGIVDAAGTAAAEAAKKVTVVTSGSGDAATSGSSIIHHGLPQGGDWTLDSFKAAKIWYMPEWALNIFENTLGFVLVALGVTLLLGIGTRISLFIQGLLYAGLTLGFIAITREPGSSMGITMLGVHIALVVAALVLSKHNRLAVLKKF